MILIAVKNDICSKPFDEYNKISEDTLGKEILTIKAVVRFAVR